MKDVELTSQPQKNTFEHHYVMINLKQSARHRKSDIEWNSFTYHVSPRSETVNYLKSLISVREAMVIIKIGSSYDVERLRGYLPLIGFELYTHEGSFSQKLRRVRPYTLIRS